MQHSFEDAYKNLNTEQKKAVDTIDGPVMVVAGPGTGKTQILAIRIANILEKGNGKADEILCLTFTNSGVKEMRNRLRKYIGSESSKVKIATFHSFGMEVVEKFYGALGLPEMPKLMDDTDAIALCDDILQNNEWQHIRPRSDTSRYFRDLKNLISLLKRERMSPAVFEKNIEEDIKNIESDEDNISSRGPTKGQMKKEAQAKIEGLSRTLEAVKFYELYEQAKNKKNLFDYDDVLENLVKIVEESDEAGNFLRENYQYILVDEHQDSSGIQNEFLEKVWGDVEKPNIFVVGDDRQLIYGFGGASLKYFENFKHTFGKATLITLVENYRSTQKILDTAHHLLTSSITDELLHSNHKENHALRIVEAKYPRDEVIAFALDIQERIKKGIDPNEITLLVPKNAQVRSAVSILRDIGIPVASGDMLNFFDSYEAKSFLRVLRVIAYPADGVSISESFFDIYSGIPPLEAHKFVKAHTMRTFSILSATGATTLFDKNDPVKVWLDKLRSWVNAAGGLSVYSLIQHVGSEFFLDTAVNHEALILRVEVVRTLLHLVLAQTEKHKNLTLQKFLEFMDRLESYNEHIPLAVFAAEDGVRVLTLHGSKGLEFDYVWIAHMDEKSFAGGKQRGFTIPASLEEKVALKDEQVLKRELFVAITRAKRFCTISYPLHSYTGADVQLTSIIADLGEYFEKQTADQTEKIILSHDPKLYTQKQAGEAKSTTLAELRDLVAKGYQDRKVSVSLLNNFFECPWKWYFRNLLQLPEPKAETLEFGNIVHGSIDMILKLGAVPKEKEIKDIIAEQVRKTGFGDEKKQAELGREAFSIVSSWVKNRLPEIAEERENEKPVPMRDERFSHLDIYGKIDLIEKINDEDIRVTDFKTGNPRKKSDIEKMTEEGPAFGGESRMSDYMRQLTMYSYLLGEYSKWNKNVVESQLEFVQAKDKKEAFYKTFIDSKHVDLLVQDIKDYDDLVKSGKWIDRPCNFKSYGKSNTVCEYCKMGEIYK